MRCCVSFCVNNSEIVPNSQNVTFHRLPTEKLRRASWIQALGIEDSNLQTVRGPCICSLHFRKEDFHTTKSGLWAVKRCAVPKTEQICIICLDTDRRLFSLNYYNLEVPYENVTGLSLSQFSVILKPRVCSECGQRLLNSYTFREQSVRAQQLLLKLSQKDELLKIETIKTVNRKKHKLKSNLTKEIFEPNHFDYHLIHDEQSKNIKKESAKRNVKVKMENIVFGSEATADVKNEAENLTIVLEPKIEDVNNDTTSDEEFMHDDIDNDGFLNGEVHKVIKNDSNSVDKCSKIENVKLLNKGIKVDVEFPNHDIDVTDYANKNDDSVNKSNCNIILPDENYDIDMDVQNENDDSVNSPDENDDRAHPPDEYDDSVNLPDENDDIDMNSVDENDSDVELVKTTVKKSNKKCVDKSKAKLNKTATLNINFKVNRRAKNALNKPRVKIDKLKDKLNKDGGAVKVRKRIRKRKTESQGQYLRRKPPTGGMELFKVSVLTYEEQVADLHSRKDTSVYKNSTFKCPYCFKAYQFEEPYDAHMQQHTDKYGQYECAICGVHTISRQKLLHHLNMAHVVRYSCTLCPFYTRHRNTAKSHGRAHKGTKTKCPHCGDVEFTNLNSLMSHVRKKHPSACVCPMCGFSFSGKTGLTLHLQRKHQLDGAQNDLSGPLCAQCDVRFASDTAYEQHLAVSPAHNTDDNVQPNAPPRRRFKGLPRRRGAQTVTCEQCGAKLKGFKHYTIHFESQHRDQTRTQFANPHERRALCERCGRVFQNSSALKSHMLIHAGKKDVQCGVCDKRFYYRRQLTMHMDTHGEPKRTYDCPVCARSFTNKSNKNRHLWTHTQVSRPFKCHACPKTFVYPSERKFHINHAHANQPYPKKPKNRVRNSRPKHVKEAPYGQIEPQSSNHDASYLSETSVLLDELK